MAESAVVEAAPAASTLLAAAVAPPVPQDKADEARGADTEDAPPAMHIPMANRLSLVSWGDGSAPSMPAAEDTDDDSDLDNSSALDPETIKSTTTSVRASVYDYVEENGRTYHRYKEGKYPLPNDIQEQARLDLQHAIFLLMAHGKSYLAPIEQPKRVLDFATGTGIWAIEFGRLTRLVLVSSFFVCDSNDLFLTTALEFPDAQVVGTDLSPIQPAL